MNRKVKSVAFNLEDPFEVDLFVYSQQYPNFSKFVKRLIQNHINGINPPQKDERHNILVDDVDNPTFNPDLMKQLL